jgi:hypothetical protein
MNQITNDINIDMLNMLFINIERKFKLKPFRLNSITSTNNKDNPKRVSFMNINSCNQNKMRIKLKNMIIRRKM